MSRARKGAPPLIEAAARGPPMDPRVNGPLGVPLSNSKVPTCWADERVQPPYGATCMVCGGNDFWTATGRGWACFRCLAPGEGRKGLQVVVVTRTAIAQAIPEHRILHELVRL